MSGFKMGWEKCDFCKREFLYMCVEGRRMERKRDERAISSSSFVVVVVVRRSSAC